MPGHGVLKGNLHKFAQILFSSGGTPTYTDTIAISGRDLFDIGALYNQHSGVAYGTISSPWSDAQLANVAKIPSGKGNSFCVRFLICDFW